MIESNPIIRAFLDEAREICQKKPFLGPPNHAMFWAHIDGVERTRNPSLTTIRNCTLCDIYTNSVNSSAYQLGDVDRDRVISHFFDRHANDYPPQILEKAWDIFSRAFADQAAGDHAFVAVNDTRKDDWFILSELPIMRAKFSRVTSLEPSMDDGMFGIKSTEWSFEDWLKAQQVQWENPYHYLDGSRYPTALIMP